MAEEETANAETVEPGQSGAQEQSAEAGQGSAEAHSPATAVLENPFDRDEIAQFEADDVAAGAAIGKMLSLLFIYTVIVMAYVGWATWVKGWPF